MAGGITAAGVVLILVSLALAGGIGMVWMLWKRVKGLRLDMSAYRSLAAEDALGGAAPDENQIMTD